MSLLARPSLLSPELPILTWRCSPKTPRPAHRWVFLNHLVLLVDTAGDSIQKPSKGASSWPLESHKILSPPNLSSVGSYSDLASEFIYLENDSPFASQAADLPPCDTFLVPSGSLFYKDYVGYQRRLACSQIHFSPLNILIYDAIKFIVYFYTLYCHRHFSRYNCWIHPAFCTL